MKNKVTLGITLASLVGNISLLHDKPAPTITPELEKKNPPIKKVELIDRALLDAMITIESNGKVYAYNKHTGAVGLMQLTPIVYKGFCNMSKQDAFNPDKNVACGSLYMHHLLAKYNNNLEKALLHYNNGNKITNKKYGKKVIAKMEK